MRDKVNLFNEIEAELKENILPFWIKHTIDEENGGFYGFISNDLVIDKAHHRSCVLYSRILWTYSTAYKLYKEEKYLHMAEHAYDYIVKHFIDKTNSGVYWMLDYKGNVLDSKKQIYAIAFAIYAFSEYFAASGRQAGLDISIELFHAIENHAYDKTNKGYIEATTVDWLPLEDMSLSPKDMNTSKSMNTHLHVMEAYTNLLRVWDNNQLRESLKEIINVTIDHIIDPQTYHFKLFFDNEWNSLSEAISFGHDIEGSWLLVEAAEVLKDDELIAKAKDIAVKMAQITYDEGIDRINGGLYYEKEDTELNTNKDWWPQAEAVVGFVNAYQLTGQAIYLDEAIKMWQFIDKYIVDKVNGEWVWGTTADGSKVTSIEKVGPWKCPYHNSRMCFEIIERFKKITI